MSVELQFPEPDEAQAVLQDVLAFINTCEELDTSYTPARVGVKNSLSISRDRGDTKRQRVKGYSPVYERRRREKKKAEREELRTQVQQYETQLELLRLQKPVRQIPCSESKWGWVQAATAEEDKRHKAEELNQQLRGLLVQHLSAAQMFKDLLTQESGILERAQTVLGRYPLCVPPTPLATFSDLASIGSHLKGMIGQLYAASDFVFDSASIFKEDANSLGSLATAASLKWQDPLAGHCIEVLSSTPLACNFTTAVQLMWDMMVSKEVFGPAAACYKMKTKIITQNSAEMGYSLDFKASDEGGILDGVTLMHKYEEGNRAVLIWTSMMVQEGNPYFRSQCWVFITRQSSNPEGEALRAKSRLERVQMKMLERAEDLVNQPGY
ncbi:uncharacterized protein IUM83_01067 [Phytophthora cinnamomi]|uniref:uncharacterized protein n=1 Tax=Phytophthora cinnamomi TaxID=4785 RepID=UPI00355991C7|nr:hypothetical protein IUM83_01067 [Phytophthora cinnamomi]